MKTFQKIKQHLYFKYLNFVLSEQDILVLRYVGVSRISSAELIAHDLKLPLDQVKKSLIKLTKYKLAEKE